jgi:hypothetical protein
MEMHQKDYLAKREERYEEINYSNWLQGLYIRDAIQNALHGRKAKYPEKPYSKDETEDGTNIDVYEKFRRSMRAMNERMKENDSKASE